MSVLRLPSRTPTFRDESGRAGTTASHLTSSDVVLAGRFVRCSYTKERRCRALLIRFSPTCRYSALKGLTLTSPAVFFFLNIHVLHIQSRSCTVEQLSLSSSYELSVMWTKLKLVVQLLLS